jgi:hypothetical protein
MVDIIKQDMTDIWASSGDVEAPSPAKIATGWVVEAVPRQWWNWFENRQDTNIAYMLQKGIPEWDVDTEYLTNKSYVQRNNVVYKCIVTNTNTDPSTTPANWVKAFPESSASLEALRTVTPALNKLAYFTGADTAATTNLPAFGRSLIDDADAAAGRATLSAQLASAVLTTLASVSPATNKLPYFTSTATATVTDFTAFARTLLDDADAATARATLGVDSAVDTSAALSAAIATTQPLDATLTALAGVSATTNKIAYFNGTDAATVTDFTAFGRSVVGAADAAAGRVVLDSPSNADLTAAIATAQPLNSTLTSLSGVTVPANSLPYISTAGVFASLSFPVFSQTLTTAASAASARTTLGLGTVATESTVPVAKGGTGGTTQATARSGIGAASSGANSDITSLSGLTTPLSIAQGGTGADNAATARSNLGISTGAAATVQTSTYDTTAGRVTIVGAFGLGNVSAAAAFYAGNDLNTSTTGIASGWYFIQTSTAWSPVAGFEGIVRVDRLSSAVVYQEAWMYASQRRFSRLTTNSGTSWTAWAEEYNTSNFNPATKQNTLGYVPIAADNATIAGFASGSLVIPYIANGGNIAYLWSDANAATRFANMSAASAIGTYSFLKNFTGVTVGAGTTVAGGNLMYSDTALNNFGNPPGTWRCMSAVAAGAATLFLRVS